MLLAIPALRVLRRGSPGDNLVLAAQPRIARLLELLGVVHRAVDFDALGLHALFEPEWGDRRREWPARCSDDLRRATRVIAWIGAREPSFVERLTALVPGSIVAPSVGAERPVWAHLLHTVGASSAPLHPAIRGAVDVPDAVKHEARAALTESRWNGRDRLLIVHPGAGGSGKRWPTAGFAAVLERVAALPGVAIAVHRGPADADAVAALPEALTAGAIALREPPLPLLAGTLAHATAYLGNDSGISHLAAAVGVPSIVLFGAERLIWRPWAQQVEPLVVSPEVERSEVTRVTQMLTAWLR